MFTLVRQYCAIMRIPANSRRIAKWATDTAHGVPMILKIACSIYLSRLKDSTGRMMELKEANGCILTDEGGGRRCRLL